MSSKAEENHAIVIPAADIERLQGVLKDAKPAHEDTQQMIADLRDYLGDASGTTTVGLNAMEAVLIAACCANVGDGGSMEKRRGLNMMVEGIVGQLPTECLGPDMQQWLSSFSGDTELKKYAEFMEGKTLAVTVDAAKVQSGIVLGGWDYGAYISAVLDPEARSVTLSTSDQHVPEGSILADICLSKGQVVMLDEDEVRKFVEDIEITLAPLSDPAEMKAAMDAVMERLDFDGQPYAEWLEENDPEDYTEQMSEEPQ